MLKHFKANHYITVNAAGKEYLTEKKIGTDGNVTYIDQGVRNTKNPEMKSQDEIRIICASRLVYEKGVDLFIKAASIVRSKYHGKVKFMIAGCGEYENELKRLGTEL